MTAGSEKLFARVREIRARAAIQRWELRQRAHASGAWFRLERLLAMSRRAWAIDDRDAERLLEKGYQPQPAGLALQPPRRVFVVSIDEIDALEGAEEMVLQFSPQLLLATNLALVPFDRKPLYEAEETQGHD